MFLHNINHLLIYYISFVCLSLPSYDGSYYMYLNLLYVEWIFTVLLKAAACFSSMNYILKTNE